ncbi:Hypothetical protein PEIBARAKI_4002 [Petrimonas sp. IBARAKI]|nr:Hypothetical protein PEIBARAKI_4002 [Petrimonas sp. IBARAKI]
MSRIKRNTFIFLALLITGYATYFIIDAAIFKHSITTGKKEWRNVLFLFKDSVKQDIDTVIFGSFEKRNKDVLVKLHYIPNSSHLKTKDKYNHDDSTRIDYRIDIWQFKELSNYPKDSVKFYFNIDLTNLKIIRGEVLEPHYYNPISIKYGYSFKTFGIQADSKSVITDQLIKGENYKGFMGRLNRIALINEKQDQDIFIDFEPNMQALILVVNKNSSFYFITITCNKPFDKDILNIFDFV